MSDWTQSSEPVVYHCQYCGLGLPERFHDKVCNNCWEVASRLSFMPLKVLRKILSEHNYQLIAPLSRKDKTRLFGECCAKVKKQIPRGQDTMKIWSKKVREASTVLYEKELNERYTA